MTNEQAIAELQKEHDLIQGEHDLDGSQFAPELLEALAMEIEVLKCSEIPNCSEPKCADGCIYGWGSSECRHCDYRSEEPKTGDTISRKAAINAIRASTSKYTGFMEMEMYTDDDAVEAIEGLPSIQLSRIERELHGKTPEEQYKILYQLMFEYANTFNDARRAVIDWLGE